MAIAIFYWAFFHLKSALGGEVSSDLALQLSQVKNDEEVSVLIYLKQASKFKELSFIRAALPDRKRSYQAVLAELQERAETVQKELSAKLEEYRDQGRISSLKKYWIANLVAVTGKKEAIEELTARPEVEIVYPDYPLVLVAPVEEKTAPASRAEVDRVQTAVGAKQVWKEGLTGQGRLLCILDSGVDGSHPSLASSWRGTSVSLAESWWDPFQSQSPEDQTGHGTHVTGIICGKNAGDTIGIAPGAEWIAAAVVDRGTAKDVTVSNILVAFQWALNPDGDPNTFQDVPDVINNSWGFPKNVYPDCEEIFWQAIDNVEAAGIMVVFAAGNEGPNPYTLRIPADRSSSPYNSFSVGAVSLAEKGFEIAPFSSRGPSRCDSSKAKPELTAPGVDIYSCFPNGQYRLMSGTSMAAPFVSAAVLILRQLDPQITVEQIKEVLMKTATDLGPWGKDNDYGTGVINIAGAVEYWKEIKQKSQPALVPQEFRLGQNFPNPFNASTTIRYQVKLSPSTDQKVSLIIYNVLGQNVRTLVAESQPAGFFTVIWDGTDQKGERVASGLYFYRLEAGEFTQTRKMALLK